MPPSAGITFQSHLAAVTQAIEAAWPQRWAGSWTLGQGAYVAWGDTIPEAARAEISRCFPGVDVALVQHRYSLAQLSGALEAIAATGLDGTDVSIDVAHNKVVLTRQPTSNRTITEIRSGIDPELEPLVEVREHDPSVLPQAQAYTEAARAAQAADPVSWAGSWLDSGTLVLAWAAAPPEAINQIISDFPAIRIRAERVQYALNELTAAQTAVAPEYETDVPDEQRKVWGSAIDAQANTLQVLISSNGSETIALEFEAKYPQLVGLMTFVATCDPTCTD